MKKFVLIFLILLQSLTIKVFAEEDFPKVESKSAILLDSKTGKILWEKDAFVPMSMASTTKIMTAIITLENGNLDDTVKVSSKAAAAPKVKMNLMKDEEIKLRYLLYALMLESSNDSAVAIAEHVGGSVENFCEMMTDKAKEIGAKDTVFETPNGLDAGDHHSTSYDLAVITSYALKNPDFIKITNTSSITFSSNKRTYTMNNKNRLLNELDGANGVKTGFTNKAGHCFVGAAKRNNMQLVSVVLASGWGDKGKEQKWKDTKEILNYGFKTFKYHNIIDSHSIATGVNVERSKTPRVDLYFEQGLEIPLSDNEYKNLRVEIKAPELVRAPVLENEKLGTAKIYINNELFTEIDLLSNNFAQRHDLKTCMEFVINDFISMGTKSDINVILPEF